MIRIDCQSHLFPLLYAEILARNPNGVRATNTSSSCTLDFGGIQTLKLDFDAFGPAEKLRAMDAAGIDMAVLSLNMPGPEVLPVEEGVRAARLGNEYLAELCAKHHGRFVALASLPLQDVPAAITEMDRAVDCLSLRGVVLYSHIHGKSLDATEFEPFYKRAEEREIPLVLHPNVPVWGKSVADYSMIPMLGFMTDTSIAVLRLILGGVLERYPRLKIVHPHLGGVLPYLLGRIDEQTEIKRRGRDHISRAPSEYYKNIYLDTASPSAPALRLAYELSGANRLLFASDHPWVSIEPLRDLLNGLGAHANEHRRMFGENAAELFNIS